MGATITTSFFFYQNGSFFLDIVTEDTPGSRKTMMQTSVTIHSIRITGTIRIVPYTKYRFQRLLVSQFWRHRGIGLGLDSVVHSLVYER